MSSDVAYFTEDFYNNSLAIGHPLVYHSQAGSKNTIGDASADLDDSHVSIIKKKCYYFITKPTTNNRFCNGILWIWQSMRQTCKLQINNSAEYNAQ